MSWDPGSQDPAFFAALLYTPLGYLPVVLIDDSSSDIDVVLPCEARPGRNSTVGSVGYFDLSTRIINKYRTTEAFAIVIK